MIIGRFAPDAADDVDAEGDGLVEPWPAALVPFDDESSPPPQAVSSSAAVVAKAAVVMVSARRATVDFLRSLSG